MRSRGCSIRATTFLIPSVTRTFGREDNSRLVYYFEIYPGSDSVSPIVVETKIRHAAKGMQYRDTLHLDLGDKPVRQLREISLAHFHARRLRPGDHSARSSKQESWSIRRVVRDRLDPGGDDTQRLENRPSNQLELYADNDDYLPPRGWTRLRIFRRWKRDRRRLISSGKSATLLRVRPRMNFKQAFYHRIALAKPLFRKIVSGRLENRPGESLR